MECEKGTLYNGLRVKVRKLGDAGIVKISRVEIMSEKLVFEQCGGRPYDSAYNEAEQLAITIDAEFVVDGIIIRPSLKAEYYKSKEEKKCIGKLY